MSKHPVTEFDCFFLSYDEPNADKHWADLRDKAPWSERVHGVKGFAAAHEACAEQSTTDWFITVDADNIVMPEFFDQEVELPEDRPNISYTWNGLNMMNGLQYGNGGLKLWSKAFVLGGGIGHERADDPRHAVDFCWQPDYRNIQKTFSEVWNNGSAYQAWRVGFREGVKLTLNGGERVLGRDMRVKLHAANLRNIRIWSSVGAHVEHGRWAMLGARMGWAMMTDPEWDHTLVADFEGLHNLFINTVPQTISERDIGMDTLLANYGEQITAETGIRLPILDEVGSEFFRDMFKVANV